METLHISSTEKSEMYAQLLPQLKGLIDGEPSLVANLANTAAVLRQAFHFFWVGFYLVENNELVLGPFQGDIACTRIARGKGVCGTAWDEEITIIVDDVEEFPGHIACSALSKSEIVVPIFKENSVVAILDVDSTELAAFNEADSKGLNEIAGLLSACFK